MLHDDVAGYFGFSVQQTVATSYVECVRMVTDRGWRSSDAWWMCSNQGFKN